MPYALFPMPYALYLSERHRLSAIHGTEVSPRSKHRRTGAIHIGARPTEITKPLRKVAGADGVTDEVYRTISERTIDSPRVIACRWEKGGPRTVRITGRPGTGRSIRGEDRVEKTVVECVIPKIGPLTTTRLSVTRDCRFGIGGAWPSRVEACLWHVVPRIKSVSHHSAFP